MFNFGNSNNNTGGTGAGGGLFGNKPAGNSTFSFGQSANAQPQQQTGGGFSFGGNNQQANSTGTGPGLFGSSQPSNSTSGGPFGNQSNTTTGLFGKPAGTGLFGQQQQQQQQQPQSQPSGGLFGSNQGVSSTGGGLFGNNNQNQTTGGGLFGNANQNQTAGATGSGGLFGNSNQNQNQATGVGLFGNTQNQNTGATGGGGLFGSTNQNQGAGGGLFGNNAQKPAGSTGGGLFGNTGQTTQNTNTLGSGGLFGNKPAGSSNTGGGLFGSKPATATTGGLFGGQSTNNNAAGGGLFGSKPQNQATGGLFGSGNTNTSTGLFSQPQQNQFGQTNNLSNSTQPSFAWSQPQNNQANLQQQPQLQFQQSLPQQQQQQQQPLNINPAQQQYFNYPQQMQEQIVKCKDSWDPTSSKTKLRAFVYNKANGNDALVYNKPVNISQEEWDEALDKKPSADVIPMEVLGFEGLNQRTQLQRENVAQARVILNQILEKSTQLQQKHELDTAARIVKAQSRNTQIGKRILGLGTRLAILKSRGLPLSVSEEKMWSQFQALLQRSNDPAGLGKTNELWARLAVLKERAKNISDQLDNTLVVASERSGKISENAVNGKTDSEVADDEVEKRVEKIVETLSNQQRGICYLNEVLDKDHQALDKALKNSNRVA